MWLSSCVAIGGSVGSRNRGPRPLGAPNRGHNLFYLQDAKTGFRRNRNPRAWLIGFFKEPCLLTVFRFLFPKTLTDSSDEELSNMVPTFVNKYADNVSDDLSRPVLAFPRLLVPQNVSKRHKRITRMLKNFSTLLFSSICFPVSLIQWRRQEIRWRRHNMNLVLRCLEFCLVPRLF